MHDINLYFFIHFYINAFEFETDFVITQFRDFKIIDIMNIKAMKISIM